MNDPFEADNPFASGDINDSETPYSNPFDASDDAVAAGPSSYAAPAPVKKKKPVKPKAPKPRKKRPPRPQDVMGNNNAGAANVSAYDAPDDEEEPLWPKEVGNRSSGYSEPAPFNATVEDRERTLARREAELMARERELIEREAALGGFRADNWPFSCYALAYHSIEEEVPPRHQKLVTRLYLLMLFTWLTLLWNWLVILVLWWTSGSKVDGMQSLWATIYLAFGVPGSWKLWYRAAYYGMGKDSSTRWLFFFINFIAHTGFCAVMSIGVRVTAGAGLWMMFDLYARNNPISGTLVMVSTMLWVSNTTFALFLMRRVNQQWATSGEDKDESLEHRAGKAFLKSQV